MGSWVAFPDLCREVLWACAHADLAGLWHGVAGGQAKGDDAVADAFKQFERVFAGNDDGVGQGAFGPALVEPMARQVDDGVAQDGGHRFKRQLVAATQVRWQLGLRR